MSFFIQWEVGGITPSFFFHRPIRQFVFRKLEIPKAFCHPEMQIVYLGKLDSEGREINTSSRYMA